METGQIDEKLSNAAISLVMRAGALKGGSIFFRLITASVNPITGGDANLHHPLYFLQYSQGANMQTLKTF